MKNILLVTIPHTGTRFVIKILEQQYFKSRHHIMREHTEKRPLQLYKFATCHTEYSDLIIEYIEKFNPLIITCERDYEATMSSFKKRKGNKAEEHYQKSLDGYNKIFEKISPDIILSVDSKDRDERLKKLSGILNISLDSNNWKKVGSWEEKNYGRGRDWPIHND
jgi:hypothetical protein